MRFSDFEQSPEEIAIKLKPLIEDKVVFDMGGGDGLFCSYLLTQGAQRAVNVELDPVLAERSKRAGIDTIEQNFMDTDLTDADVLYIFTSFYGSYNLTRKVRTDGWGGTIITQYYPMHDYFMNFIEPDRIVHVKAGLVYIPLLVYEWYN